MLSRCLISISLGLILTLGNSPSLADTDSSSIDTSGLKPAIVDSLALRHWLDTVWTHVDSFVKAEERRLQETTVTSGVRGTEAEDDLLGQFEFREFAWPSGPEVKNAIDVLGRFIKKSDEDNASRLQYLLARCHERAGSLEEARGVLRGLVESNPKSKWADLAASRLEDLDSAR